MEKYVNVSEIKIGIAPDILKSIAGSCVILCLWDEISRTCGMAHILMPESSEDGVRENGKYADLAVPYLIKRMETSGISKHQLVAKVSGGASLFMRKIAGEKATIGEVIYNVVARVLKDNRIPIGFKDIGGRVGRHVTFDCSTGDMTVKTISDTKEA